MAWIVLVVVLAALALATWWLIRHPKVPVDRDDAWLTETYGLAATQRVELRTVVMSGRRAERLNSDPG